MYAQEIPNQVVESHWMLPEDFRVYAAHDMVVNNPIPGFEERILPTFNHYRGVDGGYVAVYTRNEEKGVYGVGEGIHVVGQIRLQGKYAGRIFIPNGYNPGDNITRDPEILALCREYFPDMRGEVWVGGDTGGWYGIGESCLYTTDEEAKR